MQIPHKRQSRTRSIILIASLIIAAGLIGFSAWGLLRQYKATHAEAPTISTKVVSHSTDNPEETPPICDETYKVAADLPRKIDLPSLGVDGCIQQVGIDQEKAVAVPTNVHVAGWYTGSVLPGQRGVSLIDGHAQGRYGAAIFTNLYKLKKGARVEVEMGDGAKHSFVVREIKSYPVAEAAQHMLTPLNDNARQLTLITCSGSYSDDDRTYTKRIVVRAELAS